jgi:hypothetical protein
MGSENGRETEFEHAVRKRLTEAASAAGVPFGRIALEVLYLMPPDFVQQYELLFTRALRAPGSDIDARGRRAEEAAQVGKARNKGGRGVGGRSNVGSRGAFAVRDEEALKLKSAVDRQLRKLARTMAAADEGVAEGSERGRMAEARGYSGGAGGLGLRGAAGGAGGHGGGHARCAGCGRYLEGGWVFCPGCGRAVAD